MTATLDCGAQAPDFGVSMLECEVCLNEAEVLYSKGSGVVCKACLDDPDISPIGPDLVLVDYLLRR